MGITVKKKTLIVSKYQTFLVDCGFQEFRGNSVYV